MKRSLIALVPVYFPRYCGDCPLRFSGTSPPRQFRFEKAIKKLCELASERAKERKQHHNIRSVKLKTNKERDAGFEEREWVGVCICFSEE